MSVIEEMTVNPLVQSLGWTLLQRVARNSYRCGLRRRERRAARAQREYALFSGFGRHVHYGGVCGHHFLLHQQ